MDLTSRAADEEESNMQITLDHIGIIKHATLSLDGLTVITGRNNSGKTTIGKTLYALIDATCNLQQSVRRDRNSYILKRLREIEEAMGTFRFRPIPDEDTDYLSKFSALDFLLAGDYETIDPSRLEIYAHSLEEDLTRIDSKKLSELYGSTEPAIRLDAKTQTWKRFENPLSEKFNKLREIALSILADLFEELKQDPQLINYARERINQALNVEFSGQIQPVKQPGCTSLIDLSNEDSTFYHFTLEDNRIIKNGQVFFATPFRKVYLIDDPYILDTRQPIGAFRKSAQEFETVLNPNNVYTHNRKLRTALRSRSMPNAFEQTILDESLDEIRKQINAVISGAFEFSADGDYYVEDGAKIKVSNLATGSKMFSILKLLLEKGELGSSTMLILDEPEAHLHPQWQNAFAEVIVLLVKNLGVHVLLTTHSSNFMLAVDAFMRKHGINQLTSFYQTRAAGDGFVEYQCVDDDMGLIYQDFLQYLSDMKQLRNQYMHGDGEHR